MIQRQKEILEKEIEERMNAGLAAAGGGVNRFVLFIYAGLDIQSILYLSY